MVVKNIFIIAIENPFCCCPHLLGRQGKILRIAFDFLPEGHHVWLIPSVQPLFCSVS